MKNTIFSAAWMKVVIVTLCVAVTFAGIYIAVNYRNNTDVESAEEFNPEFEEDQTREENEAGASGGIEIPGYSTITVPSGETGVSVNFYNPEGNSVYFEMSLIITDTQEEIYKSKLLSPGQHLYEIELNRELEAGEYDMTILYGTYSMDEEYTPKNSATVNCVLVVE